MSRGNYRNRTGLLIWAMVLLALFFTPTVIKYAMAGPPFLVTGGGGGSGSGDLVSTNNLSDVSNAATALSNLGGEPADPTILKEADVDDVPVDGVTTAPASSNWAHDHENASNPHSITADGILPSQTGNSGKFLTTDGTNSSWGAVPGGGDLLSTNNLSDVANASTALSNLGGQPADADTSKTDVEETFSAHKTMADDIRLYLGSGQDFWFVFNATATQLELWTTDSDGGGTDAKVLAVDVGGLVTQFFGAILTAASATPTIEFRDSDDADSSVNAWIEANLTDAGSGTQDADVAISALKAGVKTNFINIDADATNPVSFLGMDIPQVYNINGCIPSPDTLEEADKLQIWENHYGSTFTITAIYAKSDTTGQNFILDEYDFDGASNNNEIDDVTCSTGSGPYTAAIESGISHTTIENGHGIYFDHVSGAGDSVSFTIVGHF
jgi:hypothetical protein